MVEEELTDGERIARLLSSEVHGHERGALGRLSVVDAADDVDPTEAGTFAYAVADGERRLAEVYAHPDRAHVEFLTAARNSTCARSGWTYTSARRRSPSATA